MAYRNDLDPAYAPARAPARAGAAMIAVGAITALGGVLAGGALGNIALAFGLTVTGIGVAALAAVPLLVTAGPGQIQVIEGSRGVRFVRSGETQLRLPFVERATALATRLPVIDLRVHALSRDAAVAVAIRAEVRVDPRADGLKAAAERFCGRPADEIAVVARQLLEGAVRDELASSPRAQIAADRDALARRIQAAADPDLRKLGLDLVELAVVAIDDA